MDVDPCPSTSAQILTLPLSKIPHIDENIDVNNKERMMELLDRLESHVEKIRKDAVKLEEEKDEILASIDTVKMLPGLNELVGLEREEAIRYLDRIIDRCMTVDVKVHTQRDKSQEESLHQVNHLIDSLVVCLKNDPDIARLKCLTYMNACSSHASGITDKQFESSLLGCTIDDQKRVKKRLHGLLRYFEKLGYVKEIE